MWRITSIKSFKGEGGNFKLDASIDRQPFVRWTWVSRYQNVSVLDLVGAKDDGDGEW